MKKRHIVVIDDEEHILELIKYNLENNGFQASIFTSVEEAMDTIDTKIVDAILLDIMLPGIDGISALEKFRKDTKFKNIPILLVTAKAEEVDKIVGLELGADDYITKPFSVRELIARVKAVIRRNDRGKIEDNKQRNVLSFGGLVLDIDSHKLTYKKEKIEVTYKEFEMLKLLMLNKGRVLTRETILDKVWGYDYFGETRTVDVHIRYLRSKLDTFGIGDCIETVRGVGYRFKKE